MGVQLVMRSIIKIFPPQHRCAPTKFTWSEMFIWRRKLDREIQSTINSDRHFLIKGPRKPFVIIVTQAILKILLRLFHLKIKKRFLFLVTEYFATYSDLRFFCQPFYPFCSVTYLVIALLYNLINFQHFNISFITTRRNLLILNTNCFEVRIQI